MTSFDIQFLGTTHSGEQNSASTSESLPCSEKGEEKVNRYTKHKSAEANLLKNDHLTFSNRD